MKRKAGPIDAVDVAKFREAAKKFMDDEDYCLCSDSIGSSRPRNVRQDGIS